MQRQSLAAETVKAEALGRAQALTQALEQALTRADTQDAQDAQESAQALVNALDKAWALVKALEKARALEARALVRGRRGGGGLAEGRARPMMLEPTVNTFTYREILADLELKTIIYSIEPHHRYGLVRHLRRRSQEHWWLIQIVTPITCLPTELLHQILLIIIDEMSGPPSVLMLVCKRWYTIVTGIWASLTLGTRTPMDAVTRKLERNQALLDVSVDTETDRGALAPSESPETTYGALAAAIKASSRWRSFVVEAFPAQADLPEDLGNHGLQRMSRLRTFKIKSACETSPLLDHLLRILGTTATEELTTIEIHSANVVSFLVPTHSSIFHSVKVLSLDTPGIPNPVDLLPHLHQLETLTASHLPLPVYHNDVNLPFVHTLRHLTLRSVSIQWMSGRTFPILETCTLLFPLHRHVLHTFHTTLPNCKHLTFEGYPLDILEGISAHNISYLSVMSSCSNKLRGNRQLAQFSSQALRESRLAPPILHIGIEATNHAWIKALNSMSNLEELVIENAQPSSLGAKVLQSLVVHPVHANNLGTNVASGGWNTPVCPSLKRFGLRYRRWLRPSEHFDLIPDFASIIWSRQQSKFSLQSFRIWTRGDQQDPMELLGGMEIGRKGFQRLANDCAINIENLLQLVVSGLVEDMGVGRAKVREFLRVYGFTPPPPPPSQALLSPPTTDPPRPSSQPTADLILRTRVSSANNLAVHSPGKRSTTHQAPPSTPSTSVGQAPSVSGFHSAGAAMHHHAAAMADLNGRNKEGSMVSSRRSTSSRRPSISSPVSFEQHTVRTPERPIGSLRAPTPMETSTVRAWQTVVRVFSWSSWSSRFSWLPWFKWSRKESAPVR
jgi:hypothetical protein